MNKKFSFLLIFILSISIYGSSNWKQITKASYSSLNSVFFTNENVGWIAGSSGTILKTTDGGNTWESPLLGTLPVVSTMYSIYFVDENIGYAGGSNDLLLKSTDGGASWSRINLDAGGGSIYSIYFSDENTGWILSGTNGSGQIAYTTDGGATWSIQVTESSSRLRSMSFASNGHGVCAGGKGGAFAFYYTKDGTSWTKAPLPTNIPAGYTKTDINAVAMASNDIACATGWGSNAAGLQPTFTIRTADGGVNWKYEAQAEANRLYVTMYGITFKDNLNGIAVGGNSYKGGIAYKTTDGGLTWSESFLPVGFRGTAISWVGNKICIVGSGGGIVVSDDSGSTWKVTTPIINVTLFDIDILPNGNILATGFYGGLLSSSDNGKTWNSSYIAGNNVCPTVEDIFFLDNNIGYAAHRNRVVSKTIDGGNTWTQIMKDTSASKINNNGVQFLNENVGFVVGKVDAASAFYKTTDGGSNWTSKIGTLSSEINSLHFFTEDKGVVVGDDNLLAYTTDSGNNWNIVSVTNAPTGTFDYFEVEFLNDNLGIACGEILAKTNDGGQTWEYVNVEGLPKKIKGCEIVDAQTWYITGDKYLFKTTDGGSTWTDVIDLEVVSSNQTYDVMVDGEGYPWISCGSSQIYTPSTIVSVKLVNKNVPDNFVLNMNYPNPFNPTTIISYSIPQASSVSLKVYNVLGQEVANLINNRQNAGNYQVEFDASNLTSGIYIYTLQSANFTQSRKMLLIK